RKFVSFHGENPDIFIILVVENHSTVFDWGIRVRLVSKDNIKDSGEVVPPPPSTQFWEGQPITKISLGRHDLAGSTRLLQDAWYEPKKDMDLMHDPSTGNYLVISQGHLDGQQTDLWISHSKAGDSWSSLERLSINSSSEDYNPRLIRNEDGKIYLTWISNRRGKGWELWMSHQKEDKRWSYPNRIPLENFADTGMEKRSNQLSEKLLEYDIFQDNRGRWVVVYYSYGTKALVFLQSKNTEEWSLLSTIPTVQACFGFSLVQDSSARYRFGMIDRRGQLYLYSSNDALKWGRRQMKFNFWDQSFFPTPTIHRMRLIPLELGHLLMLISDDNYGLQFARFHADTGEPLLDLVSRVGLEAYAATKVSDENYLVAIKQDEQVVLKNFKKFNINGKKIDKDTRGWPIYKETELDRDENTWTRIFAQSRMIVPDVTALGIEPNGRVWWGIETGVMYKHGEQFMATDVSLGFFYHFITNITCCSQGRIWFSSKYLNKPELGVVKSPHSLLSKFQKAPSRPRFQSVRIPKATGAITDVTCGQKENHIYVGTSQGSIVGFDGINTFFNYDLGPEYKVSTLAYSKKTHELWVGTENNGLYLLDEEGIKQHYDGTEILASNQIDDIVVDHDTSVWVALNGNGLMRYKDRKWTHFTPENSDLLYWSLENLVADPKKGIWYLPHGDVRSRGLGLFDGESGKSFNPPHQILPNPSSLVVEPNGVVWIGSWFNGLYRLERKGLNL
ncbi:MAG: hypothetical protein GY786_14895, partial [Proteobacteria bacterium]|nr:hypothetical protein [Pseudomonadota bacterium]